MVEGNGAAEDGLHGMDAQHSGALLLGASLNEHESTIHFSGFLEEPLLYDKLTALRLQLQDELLLELPPVDENVESDVDRSGPFPFVKWTRSSGESPTLPNVQPVVLGHKKRAKMKGVIGMD